MGAPKMFPATIIGYATRSQAAAVRAAAERFHISIAEFVRQAIEEKLRRAERSKP